MTHRPAHHLRGGPSLSNAGLSVQMYATILDGIQEQIRFADVKAGFIITLNALLFGFLATYFDSLRTMYGRPEVRGDLFWGAIVLEALYLGAMAISVGSVIFAVMPRFTTLSEGSKVFFAEIVNRYGTDHKKYVADTIHLSSDEWAEQMGRQILEVSHIALKKHLLIRRAARFTLLAFLLWRASLFVITFLPRITT